MYLKGWGFFPQNGLQNIAIHNTYKYHNICRSKTFQNDAKRRWTKKLIAKNERNLQYCVTKLI